MDSDVVLFYVLYVSVKADVKNDDEVFKSKKIIKLIHLLKRIC
jgi:hypothetical protein